MAMEIKGWSWLMGRKIKGGRESLMGGRVSFGDERVCFCVCCAYFSLYFCTCYRERRCISEQLAWLFFYFLRVIIELEENNSLRCL